MSIFVKKVCGCKEKVLDRRIYLMYNIEGERLYEEGGEKR